MRGTPLTATNAAGFNKPLLALAIGSLTMSHLFIVFFRSHGNRDIFRLYPFRFVGVPILLVVAFLSSGWMRAAGATLVVFWDVYHSSLQTFGLGRIYDRLRGNDAETGRSLDVWLNHVLYIGPLVAGASFLGHFDSFFSFEAVGSVFFTSIPAYARDWHSRLTLGVLALGIPFLFAYVLAYLRLARRGYRVSAPKVALLVSTGICSLGAWCLLPFGVALLVVNLFHAVQYFGLVGYTERKRIAGFLPWGADRFVALRVAVVLLGIGFGYGIWAEIQRSSLVTQTNVAFAVITTVSLLHFWYDGFIWSVRKKQV